MDELLLTWTLPGGRLHRENLLLPQTKKDQGKVVNLVKINSQTTQGQYMNRKDVGTTKKFPKVVVQV